MTIIVSFFILLNRRHTYNSSGNEYYSREPLGTKIETTIIHNDTTACSRARKYDTVADTM